MNAHRNMIDRAGDTRLAFVWPAALACFILAAMTGVLYRSGLAFGETLGFSLVNIRHAHSHLMYFGWVTPLLMALIATLRMPSDRRRGVAPALWIVFAGAALSYPLFLLFGYQVVFIGTAEMPLAVIGSSLNMIAWYLFVGLYVRATRGIERDRAGTLFDLALLFLVLASLGAWALALLKPLGIQSDVWTSALTHIFLDLFSEGWFVLGTIGALYAVLPRGSDARIHWSIGLICAGLPLTFAMGMPRALVPPMLGTVASIGSLLVGAGLVINALILLSRVDRGNRLLLVPIALLALKAAGQVLEAVTPGFSITSMPGMRLLYLHVMLLGFVSLALVLVVRPLVGRHVSRPAAAAFVVAVLLVIASLLMFTPAMPTAWIGAWTFRAAFCIALLPLPGAIWLLIEALRRPRRAATSVSRNP